MYDPQAEKSMSNLKKRGVEVRLQRGYWSDFNRASKSYLGRGGLNKILSQISQCFFLNLKKSKKSFLRENTQPRPENNLGKI